MNQKQAFSLIKAWVTGLDADERFQSRVARVRTLGQLEKLALHPVRESGILQLDDLSAVLTDDRVPVKTEVKARPKRPVKAHLKWRAKVTKSFGVDFNSAGGALTLPSDAIGKHADGWEIEGHIHEDWYEWVNEFEAVHPKLGKVWGNFEDKVYATSEKAFADFYKKHPPQEWDYGDI